MAGSLTLTGTVVDTANSRLNWHKGRYSEMVSVGLEIKIENNSVCMMAMIASIGTVYLHPQTEYLNWSAIFSTLVLFFGASYCDHWSDNTN